MKNKKILFGLALIASFTLCSCGSEFLKTRGTEEDFGVIELPEGFKEDNPKQGDTEDSVHYIVKHELENVNGGYDVAQTETLTAKKGEKTNALPKKYTGYEPQEVTQVDVALDGSTVVHIKYSIVRYSLTLKGDTSAGTFAGEGKYKVSEGQARLIAKPYIGYEFIGWYIGDTLLSNKLSYSLTLDSDIEVRAEFKVLDEFKDYIFESTENSCKLTGLCIDYKSVLNVPEGVTEIAADAFEDKYVRFVNMPTTLKHIESGAFYECRDCIRITINSDITVSGYPFGYTYEVLNLGNTDLSGYVSEYYTYRSSESDPTEFHIDEDGFIFRVYENYMHQTVCTLYGNINELEEIHLPESFTLGAATFDEYNIERYAFVGLTPRILYIPESVSSIESYAFTETKNLAEIFNLSSLDIEIGNSTNGGVSQYAKIIHNNQSDDKELVIGEKYDYYLAITLWTYTDPFLYPREWFRRRLQTAEPGSCSRFQG